MAGTSLRAFANYDVATRALDNHLHLHLLDKGNPELVEGLLEIVKKRIPETSFIANPHTSGIPA